MSLAEWLSFKKMKSDTRVQILVEVILISFHTDTLKKGRTPSLQPLSSYV